jgi:hypothetical protein
MLSMMFIERAGLLLFDFVEGVFVGLQRVPGVVLCLAGGLLACMVPHVAELAACLVHEECRRRRRSVLHAQEDRAALAQSARDWEPGG